MVIYNIQNNGDSSQLVIELMNDGVLIEPKAIAYVTGDLKLDSPKASWAAKLLAHFIGSGYFKPIYRGSGKIYLKATLGTYHKFSIKENEPLVIGPKAFIACRDIITVAPQIKLSLTKFFSGTPQISTVVNGSGNLVVLMPGPVVELKLQDEKFQAYSSNVAAYTLSLKVNREQAGSGWMSVVHNMIKVYRGTGSLYFTPHPNKDSKVEIK